MTITLPLLPFLDSLQSVASFLRNGFAPQNPLLLQLVKLRFSSADNSVTFLATDATIFHEVTLFLPEDTLSDLKKPLVFSVEYDTLIKFLKGSRAEEFTLSTEPGQATFSIGRQSITLPIVDVFTHPIPKIEGSFSALLPRVQFIESVDLCMSVLSTTDISFNSAIRFCVEQGKPWFYCGDRHRAVVIQSEIDCSQLDDLGVIMPAAFIDSAASALKGFSSDLIELQLSPSALRIAASSDGFNSVFYTALRAGELPDVRKAFLTTTGKQFESVFDSRDLLNAIDSVLLVGKNDSINATGKEERFYRVFLEYLEDENSLKLSCSGARSASAVLDCSDDTTGDCQIFINGEYLRRAINKLRASSEKIRMTTLAFAGRGVFGVVFSNLEETKQIVIALMSPVKDPV